MSAVVRSELVDFCPEAVVGVPPWAICVTMNTDAPRGRDIRRQRAESGDRRNQSSICRRWWLAYFAGRLPRASRPLRSLLPNRGLASTSPERAW